MKLGSATFDILNHLLFKYRQKDIHNKTKMANKVPLIGELPQLNEVVIDLGIGIFVILLFSPFVYAVDLFVAGNLSDSNHLVMIFPKTWGLFRGIGLGAGLLGLFFVYILGICSRSVLFLGMSIFRSRWIEKNILLNFVYWVLRRQYCDCDKLCFSKDDIKENFIDKGLFWRVGDPAYSCFRTELARPGSYLNEHKSYWDHEAFMGFLFERLYSLFLTFFVSYFIYGLVFLSYNSFNVELGGVIGWFLALVVAGIITFSLYKEMVFHGMAFVRIEEVLFKLFKTDNKAIEWSKYAKVIQIDKK